MRGFEVISKYKGEYVNIPTRKTASSAGYDIEVIKDYIIMPKSVCLVETGLKAYMGDDEVLKIYVRSSLAMKKGIMLANNVGIIDSDYYNNPDNEGHIMIMLYNFSNEEVIIKKYDRVAQGIFEKYLKTDNDNSLVERLGGFGSTGR